MPMTPNRRDVDRIAAERDVPAGFSLAAIRARNGVTDRDPVRLVQPTRRRTTRKPRPQPTSRPAVDPAVEARHSDRYRELRAVFTPDQATALVLAGYAMRPGRYQTSAAGVAGHSHYPVKDGHDPSPPGEPHLHLPRSLPAPEVTGDA